MSTLPMNTVPIAAVALPARPSKRLATVTSVLVGLVIIVAAARIKMDWAAVRDLPGDLWHYLRLMFEHPNWSKTPRALREVWRSISMAWLGAILCVVISIPLGIVSARGVGHPVLRLALRAVFALLRAFPEVIIALVLLTVTGLTPFTGALALGISGIGTQGKWVYETVESTQVGAVEAVRAAGGNLAEVIRWAIWPAVLPTLLSFALYRFEINIRTSAVLGLVGAGGVGQMLSNYTNFREWDTVGMLLIVVVVATMVVDLISGSLRRRIMQGADRTGGLMKGHGTRELDRIG